MAACAIPVSAWIVQACSPTAPQFFAPDVSLPLFDSSPAIAFDSGTEPVRVTVASGAGPIANAMVVFHDGSGKVIGSTTTDSAGHAEKLLAAGTGVTILFGSAQTTLQAVTYLAVEPGDLLVAFDATTTPNNTQVTIQDVPGSPPSGTTGYGVLAGNCDTFFQSPPSSMYLYSDCLSPNWHFPLLVEAFDPNSVLLGYAYRKDLALDFDAGATVSVADAAWSTTQVNWSVILAGTQPQQPPTVVLSEVAGFVPLTSSQQPNIDSDGGLSTPPFQLHVGYPDFVQTELQTSGFGPVGTTFSVVTNRTAAPSKDATLTMDLSKLPPAINTMKYDYGTAQPTVTFTPDAPITNASGTFVVFSWTNSNEAGSTSNLWTIIAPPSMTTITAPELPSPSGDDWTTASLVFSDTPTVTVMSFDALKSYADFRRAAAAIPPPNYNTVGVRVSPLLPLDGTLALSAVGPYLD
jgi:hypothetical protein